MPFRRLVLTLLAIGSLAAGDADPLAPAVGLQGIDAAATLGIQGAVPPAEGQRLRALLDPGGNAEIAVQPVEDIARFRLVLARPTAIGTVLAGISANGGNRSVTISIPAGDAVADPQKAADWVDLPTMLIASEGKRMDAMAILPPNRICRAVLVTVRGTSKSVQIANIVPLIGRLANLTRTALASGEQGADAGDPSALVNGQPWWNTAAEKKGPQRAPVAKQPSWAMLQWDRPQDLCGLRLSGTVAAFHLETFTGPDDAEPVVAPASMWRRLEARTSPVDGTALVAFPTLRTRAIRAVITETAPPGGRVVRLSGLTCFGDLKSAPAPAIAGQRQQEAPPARIDYTLARDSEVAIAIDDAKGRRVRNLIAQTARKAGPNQEGWDLTDDQGRPVPAGAYTWKLIEAPPPVPRYVMTVYPDVENRGGDRMPWLREPQDGWLADHANQKAVAVVGERVYMGSSGAEGGNGMLEANFEGQRQRGWHKGGGVLVSDGRTLFHDDGRGSIARLDPVAGTSETVAGIDADACHAVGIAARDGSLYQAFVRREPHLATVDAEADFAACTPQLPASVPRKDNYGIPLKPQRDFASLFRLDGFIAGDTRGGTWLESDGLGPRQHIVLALKRPTALGALAFPRHADHATISMSIAVLKADAPYPPRPLEKGDWITIETGDLRPWNCLPVPSGCVTRAVRLEFSRGGKLGAADEATGVLDMDKGGKAKVGWKGRIEGMRLLRRRVAGQAAGAVVAVSSGRIDPATGVWDAARTTTPDGSSPATMCFTWPQARKLCGVAVMEIHGERTEIDVWDGPGAPDPAATAGWRQAGTWLQPQRNHYQPDATNNVDARYLDGVVDFGREEQTTGLRLRIVKTWTDASGRPKGQRRDRGGKKIDTRQCLVYGVEPLSLLGGEPPLPAQERNHLRITAPDKSQRLVAVGEVGRLAFHPDGRLFTIVGRRIRPLDPATGQLGDAVAADLLDPTHLVFDGKGRLYAYDRDPARRCIRMYDASLAHVRDIGTPGPRKAGPYDPRKLDAVSALAADDAGRYVWAVYPHEDPRRIVRFDTAGDGCLEHLGNTNYGGGGQLDPWDPGRLWHKNLLFSLDAATGRSRITDLVSLEMEEASVWGGSRSFRPDWAPLRISDRTYLVSTTGLMGPTVPLAFVYRFDEQTRTVRFCAAMGRIAAFPKLRIPQVYDRYDGAGLGTQSFLWTDRNGDGEMAMTEVEFPDFPAEGFGPFDRGLGVQMGGVRFEPKEFLADGTPVFAWKRSVPGLLRLDDGSVFAHGDDCNRVLAADGSERWRYPASWGMQGLTVPGWKPGTVDLQFGISGHGRMRQGDLGEFVAIHGNNGQMNLWTADGLLAGHATLHMRDPRARHFGSFGVVKPGTLLPGLTLGQEHFHHALVQSERDGRVFITAGGNWISVLELTGMDAFRRLSGSIAVDAALMVRMQEWRAANAEQRARAAPRILAAGSALESAPKASIDKDATFRIAIEKGHLAASWDVASAAIGNFANGGEDFRRAFKTGACVDLMLGCDPRAAQKRSEPVAGDIRILVTSLGGKPTAILYRPKAAGGSGASAWQTTTEAGGTTSFDAVEVLSRAEVRLGPAKDRVLVTLRVPLADIGLKPEPAAVLRMDWGVLGTQDGTSTTSRDYWADTTANGVMDEPTEARLTPNRWGWLRLPGQEAAGDEDALRSLK